MKGNILRIKDKISSIVDNYSGINVNEIKKNKDINKILRKVLESNKPEIINIIIDPEQKIIPKLQFGNPIEDLSPLLPRKEFKKNMMTKLFDKKFKNFTEAN
jgi:acetolactate synthase-1/2/3 large subunit